MDIYIVVDSVGDDGETPIQRNCIFRKERVLQTSHDIPQRRKGFSNFWFEMNFN